MCYEKKQGRARDCRGWGIEILNWAVRLASVGR